MSPDCVSKGLNGAHCCPRALPSLFNLEGEKMEKRPGIVQIGPIYFETLFQAVIFMRLCQFSTNLDDLMIQPFF